MQRQTLTLPDGRTLAYRIYGDAHGMPVLALHGAPATSLLYEPAHDAAASLQLRLVCPDRPGYGGSTALPGHGLASWTADCRALLEALHIDRFAILGISGGGPYAVQCATDFGPRVTALALVSPVGPMAPSALSKSLPLGFWLFFRRLPRRPRLQRLLTRAMTRAVLRHPDHVYGTMIRGAPLADRKILRRPAIKQATLEMTREALSPSIEGAIADLAVYGSDWTPDTARIVCPSVLWQGTADRTVPPAAALALGAKLPRCTVHVIEGAGHFWIYDHIPDVLQTVRSMALGH
jgi:pimeloyl-ACP methyl ester carboxylesterase